MLDTKALAASVAIVVREVVAASVPAAVATATEPLIARIAELEGRKAEPGKDADPAVIRAMVDEAVAAIKIPTPKDGISVDVEQVRQMVADAVAAVPPAEPGKDADPEVVKQMVADAVAGISVPTPRDGVDADMDQVRAWIDEAVSAIPLPSDGKSVTVADVTPVIADEVAKAVSALPIPKDGVGLAGALINRTGTLVVTLSDGKVCELGPVEGKDGNPGLGFDDLSFEHDGERGIILRFARGDQVKEFTFSVPTVLDRGVFKEGTPYETGDAVTFGGSLWIAQKDTVAKPDGPDTGWRLAVKKGRDGRDLTGA
jgi:hypothetical protein